jgi:uncharacterized Zn finger protein (UPF0148 family)
MHDEDKAKQIAEMKEALADLPTNEELEQTIALLEEIDAIAVTMEDVPAIEELEHIIAALERIAELKGVANDKEKLKPPSLSGRRRR